MASHGHQSLSGTSEEPLNPFERRAVGLALAQDLQQRYKEGFCGWQRTRARHWVTSTTLRRV